MFAKIIQTIFSKGIISIINFLVVLITANWLGAQGRGEISLMFLNITVLLLFNDIFGGSALVYVISKKNTYELLLPAVCVGVLCAALGPLLFHLYFHFSVQDLGYFFLLTLLSNLSSISNVFLNGLEKIKQNNLASIAQSVAIIGSLLVQFFLLNSISVQAFYRSLALGYFFNLLISAYYLRGSFSKTVFSWKQSLKKMARYGLVVQAGNIFQLLNYRFCYYVLNSADGLKDVGVFSTAASISEAVWVIMNGIAMVQYATLSNRGNQLLAQNLTIKLSKISFALSLIALLALNLLPNQAFVFLFGIEFVGIKTYCLLLAPGIAFCALSGIYSHYFSARGNMKISAASALIGLVATLVCSFTLIPRYGATGAAYTCCASYTISSLFLLLMFKKESGATWFHLLFKIKKIFPLVSKQ
ncbi:MAG: polysaccharide biosynthesis C-terminal domain-containing protein [Bacteroidetes bacterium]|nr:polysaccharide biosynthesis C-terminal domain-containing protein [Bacteroidota bacterium]